jgi:dipeptidase E
MKLYLSSYKLGNEVEKLKALIPGGNRKVAYIPNALDFASDLERRKKSEQADLDALAELDVEIERIDLRDFFGRQQELEQKLSEFGTIWVRGGNVFILRQAMKKSSFDEIIHRLMGNDGLLYGGYSSGICVLAPTLKGLDLVDDPNIKPYGDSEDTIYEGLNVIDYAIVPHYQSEHPESEKMEEVVSYMKDNNIPFKTLKDGEVIIVS